jgi:hypothetical protein
MRFENSALESIRIGSLDLNDLRGSRETAYDPNCRSRYTGQPCQKSYDCFVGLAVHRRRGDVKLPGFAELSREFGFASPGADFKRESCFHLQLSFATGCGRADR